MSNDSEQPLYCYNHPKRETHLRCNRCGRPICSSCAVLTPTGYTCKECIRGQQKKFDTAKWWDYPVAAASSLIIAAIGSYFVTIIGIFTIFLAPFAGIAIAEAARFLVGRRRSRSLPIVITVSTFIGGVILTLAGLVLAIAARSSFGISGLLSIIWPVVYVILATSSAYYRSKGITF